MMNKKLQSFLYPDRWSMDWAHWTRVKLKFLTVSNVRMRSLTIALQFWAKSCFLTFHFCFQSLWTSVCWVSEQSTTYDFLPKLFQSHRKVIQSVFHKTFVFQRWVKKNEKRIMDLVSVCNPLKKTRCPAENLRNGPMGGHFIRFGPKRKVCIHHLIFEVHQSWVKSPNS